MAGADEKKESEPPSAGKGRGGGKDKGDAPKDSKGGAGGEKGGAKGGKGGDAEVAAVVAPKEIEEVRERHFFCGPLQLAQFIAHELFDAWNEPRGGTCVPTIPHTLAHKRVETEFPGGQGGGGLLNLNIL